MRIEEGYYVFTAEEYAEMKQDERNGKIVYILKKKQKKRAEEIPETEFIEAVRKFDTKTAIIKEFQSTVGMVDSCLMKYFKTRKLAEAKQIAGNK